MRMCESFCPNCGKRNRGLLLEETDGWMECIQCHQDVHLEDLKDLPKALPFRAAPMIQLATQVG